MAKIIQYGGLIIMWIVRCDLCKDTICHDGAWLQVVTTLKSLEGIKGPERIYDLCKECSNKFDDFMASRFILPIRED